MTGGRKAYGAPWPEIVTRIRLSCGSGVRGPGSWPGCRRSIGTQIACRCLEKEVLGGRSIAGRAPCEPSLIVEDSFLGASFLSLSIRGGCGAVRPILVPILEPLIEPIECLCPRELMTSVKQVLVQPIRFAVGGVGSLEFGIGSLRGFHGEAFIAQATFY